ncbi:MAG: hypothetical protein JWO79_1205 [Actinomycetia bacterium]|nr:hypothetical protein [Actinomycetes bacterium]
MELTSSSRRRRAERPATTGSWWVRLSTSCALVGALLVGAGSPSEATPTAATPVGQGAIRERAAALGSGWKASADTLITGIGDSEGFRIYAARERDGFAWKTLATLTVQGIDSGPWIGDVCVTGSGRYAVAVYAPAIAANKPAMMRAGGLAAVVDINTGEARQIPGNVQLAYFNPACGPTDTVLLTRAVGEDMQQTAVLRVDAATAKVMAVRRVKAQLTTPVAAPDGDYGMARGALVRVAASGALTTVAKPTGQVYAVRATLRDGINLLSMGADNAAIVSQYRDGTLRRLGTGKRLQLFPQGNGTNALVGNTTYIQASPGLAFLPSDRRVVGVSQQGHLQLLAVSPREVVEKAGASLKGGRLGSEFAEVTVRATRTGTTSTAVVAPSGGTRLDAATAPRTAKPASRPEGALAADDVNNYSPTCAVPRNDLTRQALQPTYEQAQWAVNQATHGTLTVQRPANYLNTGQPAYTPQGLFPLPSGWQDKVPSQVMLAILAQETNIAQAARRMLIGDAGSPLISDYYGTRKTGVWDRVDFAQSDCGYGIGQVTDGMRVSDNTSPRLTAALSTDYAANIARSMQILIGKWTQVEAAGVRLNDSDPRYIENWYAAVWAYNSGFHTYADRNTGDANGHWGLGWFNNPANPVYPADRHGFLRDGLDDAAHPEHWTYPEKIMGWAEHPQIIMDGLGNRKYHAPTFGKKVTNEQLTQPGRFTFCSTSINACNSANVGNPCPANDSTCWWVGQVSWTTCADWCATEWRHEVGAGVAEPAMVREVQPACTPFTGSGVAGKLGTPVVIDDIKDSRMNVVGCPAMYGGKFTLRTGWPAGRANQGTLVDLHQNSSGYLGHSWFTHSYSQWDRSYSDSSGQTHTEKVNDPLHTVVGTWSPDLGQEVGSAYTVLVHLPSHYGSDNVGYVISHTQGTAVCNISQDTTSNGWRYLGTFELNRKSDVRMSNIVSGGNGSSYVGFDAMAFVPVTGAVTASCGASYSGA